MHGDILWTFTGLQSNMGKVKCGVITIKQGFISSIIAGFNFVPDIIIKACDYILSPFLTATVKISDFISNLPNANLTTIQNNVIQIIIYYLIVAGFTNYIFKKSLKYY